MSDQRLILLVDDDQELRFALSLRLRSQGYRVEMCGDGMEALKLLRALRPDVVVLDVEMPVCGGVEVLETVADDPEFAGIDFIVLSGRITSRKDALHHGAKAFLAKPYTYNELLCTIEMLLEQRLQSACEAQPANPAPH